MKKTRFNTLRSTLILWAAIIGLAPLVVSVFIVYYQQSNSIKREAFDKLAAVRDLKVRELERWMDARTGNLKTISTDKEIMEIEKIFLKSKQEKNILNSYNTVNFLIVRYLNNYSAYKELFIVNPKTGVVELSSDRENEGRNVSDDKYFTEPLQTKKIYIKGIYYSKFLKKTHMTFSIPIFSTEQTSHIIGILVARIDLENSLYNLLQNRTGLGSTGETLIVNRDVIALNPLKSYENAPLKYKVNGIPAIKAANGETGIMESVAYDGEKILAAYTHIPQTGWGFVAKQNLSELYAPIKSMIKNFIIIIAFAVVIVFILGFYVAKTIAEPVGELAVTAKNMKNGNFSVRSYVKNFKELIILAESFNIMAESIESKIKLQKINDEIIQTAMDAKNLSEFKTNIFKKLIDVTNSQLGVYFSLNRDTNNFEPFTSVGITSDSLKSFSVPVLEGELGMVTDKKKIIHINNIPEETIFTFRTFTGTIIPKGIISIPVIIDDAVSGIISLASIKPYSQKILNIMEQPWVTGCSTILSNMWANAMTKKFAMELEQSNEKLQAQTEELEAQNEEFEAQTEELEAQNEELEAQAKELRTMNEKNYQQNIKLETQNRILESQSAQVQEADRLKSEFLSNMSHELRTPLNSIMALSHVLSIQTADKFSKEETGYLEIIARNGKQLLSLINDILDLSKIEAGMMDISPKFFSITSTVETITEMLEPVAKKNEIKFSLNISDDISIESDETRVYQIIQNLVSNAVKFTNKGVVTISLQSDNENIYIDVSDTGIGISKEDIPYIFNEFRQVDGTSARLFEGTGLGLAIAYKSAQMLGGDLTVKSRLGKGSVFSLRLPVRCRLQIPALEPVSLRKPEKIMPEQKAIPAADKILLVDDNDVSIIQVKTILEDAGYLVDVARGGKQALEYILHTVPKGIVLDLMMPEIDGFKVLNKIRSREKTAMIPVLVLTARDLTPEDLNKLNSNKISQIIQKGDINKNNLISKIQLMLGAKTGILKQPADRERTILVIEDNPDNMITIKAVLQSKYNILEAVNGEEGLKKIREKNPDLVMLDISLPKMDGFAVIKKAKQDKRIRHIPLIALTAHAMKNDREKIIKAGADDYLAKPIDVNQLLKKTNNWLKN